MMVNLQAMYPKSPIVQLEFDDWVEMRLEKVENDSKALQLRISAAIAKSIRKGDGDYIEIGSFMTPPAVDRKIDASPKITNQSLLPAIDFNGNRADGVSSFNSGRYRDQCAGIGPQATRNDRHGCERIWSAFVLLETSFGLGAASSPSWDKCRGLWGEVEPDTTEDDHWARIGAGKECDIHCNSSSSMLSLSETPSTFGSPVSSLLLSPVESPEIRTALGFDYVPNCAATEAGSFFDSRLPTGHGIGLGLDHVCLDKDSDPSWSTEDEFSDGDEEFFC